MEGLWWDGEEEGMKGGWICYECWGRGRRCDGCWGEGEGRLWVGEGCWVLRGCFSDGGRVDGRRGCAELLELGGLCWN